MKLPVVFMWCIWVAKYDIYRFFLFLDSDEVGIEHLFKTYRLSQSFFTNIMEMKASLPKIYSLTWLKEFICVSIGYQLIYIPNYLRTFYENLKHTVTKHEKKNLRVQM